MMKKEQRSKKKSSILLLLLFLLIIHLIHNNIFSSSSDNSPPVDEIFFLRISGDIQFPGTYGFPGRPEINDIILRAGGIKDDLPAIHFTHDFICQSGSHILLHYVADKCHIRKSAMNAFHKYTFKIPISLNNVSAGELVAIPGIGSKIATAIIKERSFRGSFQSMDELLDIKGIGPKLYDKIKICLIL